jgi:rubrerythrin
MMTTDHEYIEKLLTACIELEVDVGRLYRLFSELFCEDREFWSQLYLEEKHHASLLRAALDSYTKRNILPLGLVPASLDDLVQSNMKIRTLLEECKTIAPSRMDAFRIAIDLEKESGEQHYNMFMGQVPDTMVEEVFQKLNQDDKNHEARIRSYHNRLLEAEV